MRITVAVLFAGFLAVALPTGPRLMAGPAAAGAQEPPAVCPFGPGDLPMVTNPGAPHGAQIPINHILVLMQENRSFDHYFGRLHSRNTNVERVPRDASNPDPLGGKPIRPFHQKRLCETADLDHSWNGTHDEWNGGAMDGFTAANVDPTDPSGRRTMGYYTSRDIPFYYGLYGTFATSDRHFCSVLSQTFPNRHFLATGTSFGKIRNDLPTPASPYTARTIFQSLDEAGVEWKVYYAQFAFATLYQYVGNNATAKLRPLSEYFADAAAGTLPQVAFIDPIFLGDGENDEHPPSNVQKGQQFVAGIVEALLASPNWSDSALFITYDEHGGYWDHVPPPPACAPDDTPPLLRPGDQVWAFDRYGVRVPMVAVSPFARRKYVSHETTDQTSVLRFIETRFDLPALTRRDANAHAMLDLFDFENPSFMTPPKLPKARIDARRALNCP